MVHVSMLNHVLPDSSGDVFPENYGVKATNDFWLSSVWVFNDTSTDLKIHGRFRIPADYSSSPAFNIEWTSTATSGNVRWGISYRGIGGDDSESMDQATAVESVEVTDAAPSAAHERNLVAVGSPTSGNFTAGETVEFLIYREGTDTTNDTMAAAAILFDVYFDYTAA